jgi:hypothetical protein
MNKVDAAALNVWSSSSPMPASGHRDMSGETDARRKFGAGIGTSDHADVLDRAR